MEEPDADELAWMACEQFPEEDYEEFYEEDGADARLRASHPAPGTPHSSTCTVLYLLPVQKP